MKRMVVGVALLAASFLVVPLRAQEAQKKKPGPAPSPSEAVLEQWNDIGRKLIAMAGDFPEDKYQFKPQAESRTFLANIIHASSAMYYRANGLVPPESRPKK